MELSHTFTVPATVDQTWGTFMDLPLVGGCFPGATVTEVTEEGFAGTVKVKLGPIALVYSGTGAFVERDDGAHRAVIEAKGKDKRGNGTAGATVTIQLTDAGDGSTRADVQTDLAVTGKPAQFGRGVMQDVSDKLLGQFIGCIEGKIGDAQPRVAEEGARHDCSRPHPARGLSRRQSGNRQRRDGRPQPTPGRTCGRVRRRPGRDLPWRRDAGPAGSGGRGQERRAQPGLHGAADPAQVVRQAGRHRCRGGRRRGRDLASAQRLRPNGRLTHQTDEDGIIRSCGPAVTYPEIGRSHGRVAAPQSRGHTAYRKHRSAPR